MTNEEAKEIIDEVLLNGRVTEEAHNIAFWSCIRIALEKIDRLNAELERMKEWAYSCNNRAYSTGFISCASFAQAIIAAGGSEENDE